MNAEIHALIIEDDPSNSLILSTLLQRQGIISTLVFHPHDLAEILEQVEQLDVIFLDLTLPGQNGFEVYWILRDDPRFGSTPIVAYTAHPDLAREAHRVGFHSFLIKPLNLQAFTHQLSKILQGTPVWDVS